MSFDRGRDTDRLRDQNDRAFAGVMTFDQVQQLLEAGDGERVVFQGEPSALDQDQ